MTTRIDALTDKEKQVLRLLVRGHDAKSIARHLALSVHTINERLRDARRKLAVASSREAARLLFEHEDGTPDSIGDMTIGEAAGRERPAEMAQPENGRALASRPARLATGVTVMSLALALLALTTLPPTASPPAGAPVAIEAPDPAVETAARSWLALVDASRWEESWAATGRSFRTLNTSQVWAAASQKARVPLGAMRSRTLISQDDVPAPPRGYWVVKFRTDFANRQGVVETVSLDQEEGGWRVVGIYLG